MSAGKTGVVEQDAGRTWTAHDISRWVHRLGPAGVQWPTTRRLAVTVRLAGLDAVAGLGPGAVDGAPEGRTAVRGLLDAAARVDDPASFLHAVARVQRLVTERRDVAGPAKEGA